MSSGSKGPRGHAIMTKSFEPIFLAAKVLVGAMLLFPPVGHSRSEMDSALDAGESAYMRRDFQEAYQRLLPIATQGHPFAQYLIGKMYDKGTGVPRDGRIAVQWYRCAAERGHVYAPITLAQMFWAGRGVPKDPAQVRTWFVFSSMLSGNDKRPPITELRQHVERALEIVEREITVVDRARSDALLSELLKSLGKTKILCNADTR